MVNNKPTYAVHMIKKNSKSQNRIFIVTQLRRDEFGSAVFHGIGYWVDTKPVEYKVNKDDIIELWIPWDKIDHVESLVYRPYSQRS